MVMLNYTLDEINRVLGKKVRIEDYERIAFKYGLDLDINGEAMNFELTSDRIDIASKYSLSHIFAPELSVNLKRDTKIGKGNPIVIIEKTHRPFVNLLHVKLRKKVGSDFQEIIKMQERLDKNVGRNRRKAAIGFFDYKSIKFPIKYCIEKPEKVSFVPLGYTSNKNYFDIIKDTKQGQEYGELLNGKPIIWVDSENKIIAIPPIINSDINSINENTQEMLVDITGTDIATVNSITSILIYNLQFLGSVAKITPSYKDKLISTKFSVKTHTFILNEESIKSLLGVHIQKSTVKSALESMDYSVKISKNDIIINPPFYRQDIMHQVDIIDDIMRSIGVDKITEVLPHSYTEGGFLKDHYINDSIKEILVGFGYQEIDINVLTNEKYQFEDTFLKGEDYVSLIHLKSGDVTMAAKNIFPELLRLISNNLHKKFPQNIFSLSDVVEIGYSDVIFKNNKKLSIVSCSKDVNVTDTLSIIKKVLADSFMIDDIKAEYCGEEFSRTFINGRGYYIYAGEKNIGVAGELHPRVLNAFGVELPISIAEIDIEKLLL